MKRSLWGNGQRRSDPEVNQGRPGPTLTAPARYRPVQQRRGPLTADERPVMATYYPAAQSSSMDGRLGGEQNLRRNAPAAAVALSEIEAELRRQTELARIRDEIMDIAREVAELRRHEDDDATRAAMPNRARPPHAQLPVDIGPQKSLAQAPRAAQSRIRPQQPRPAAPSGRRPQPMERTHRNLRAGPAETTAVAAPARALPPPVISLEDAERFTPAQSRPAGTGDGQFRIAARTALLAGVMMAVLTGSSAITLGLLDRLAWPGDDRQKSVLAETTASVPAAKPSQLQLSPSIEQPSTTYPFEIPTPTASMP